MITKICPNSFEMLSIAHLHASLPYTASFRALYHPKAQSHPSPAAHYHPHTYSTTPSQPYLRVLFRKNFRVDGEGLITLSSPCLIRIVFFIAKYTLQHPLYYPSQIASLA